MESYNSRQLLQAADLDGEMEMLREDLRRERDRHLRTLADFKNFRRRVEREAGKLAESGKREILLGLIGVVDDMEKALQWADAKEGGVGEGLQNIHRKILAILEGQEVRPFESAGKAFTPDLHEAVAMVKDSGARQGVIVDDVRRGYMWKEELLRPAQVRVAG
jgi:molecular chaperone GrpE